MFLTLDPTKPDPWMNQTYV